MLKPTLLGFVFLAQASFASFHGVSLDENELKEARLRFNLVTTKDTRAPQIEVLGDDTPEVLRVRELIKNIDETHTDALLEKWDQVPPLLRQISLTALGREYKAECASLKSCMAFDIKQMRAQPRLLARSPELWEALAGFLVRHYPSLSHLWQRIAPLSLKKPEGWDADLEVLGQETAPILGKSYPHTLALLDVSKGLENLHARRAIASPENLCQELVLLLGKREDLPAHMVCESALLLMKMHHYGPVHSPVWYCMKMTKACLEQGLPAPQALADLYVEAKAHGMLQGRGVFPHDMVRWDELIKTWPINIENPDPLGCAVLDVFKRRRRDFIRLFAQVAFDPVEKRLRDAP